MIIQCSPKRLGLGYYKLDSYLTPLRGYRGSFHGFGGIDLVVTIMWKGVFDNKFTSISTSKSTTTSL
jgi:hypothetical protein